MTDDAFSELAKHHQRQRAPQDALEVAVSTYTAHQGSPRRWPLLAAAAAVVCAVILMPAVVRLVSGPGQGIETQPRLASLSLSQLRLPARPVLAISAGPTPSLASITRLSIRAPNLNQLSATGGQVKETK